MLQTFKKCGHCKQNKHLNNFCRNKRTKDGINWTCKDCVSIYNRSKKAKERRKVYLNNRTEEMKQRERSQRAKYTKENRERKAIYDVEYRKINADRIRKYKKKWEDQNKNNPLKKIKHNLRRRVIHVLKGNLKADKTFALIGCSAEDFKRHIESLWAPGMSWENYGEWHIDHIKECFRFDLSDPEQQRICFHYTNQRPLWKKDNLTRKRTE